MPGVIWGGREVKLIRAGALAVVLLSPLTSACGSQLGTAKQPDVVIAADLELHDTYADIGTTYQRALQLRMDEINAAGGIADGRMLRLVVHDNRSDPGVAV